MSITENTFATSLRRFLEDRVVRIAPDEEPAQDMLVQLYIAGQGADTWVGWVVEVGYDAIVLASRKSWDERAAMDEHWYIPASSILAARRLPEYAQSKIASSPRRS